jgi:hypothetical protein
MFSYASEICIGKVQSFQRSEFDAEFLTYATSFIEVCTKADPFGECSLWIGYKGQTGEEHSRTLDNNDDVLQLRLEQYKLAVEMLDRTLTRRQQTNSFYATINTALVAAIAAKKSAGFISPYICIAGGFLCILWYFNVRRYHKINDAKRAEIT